MSDVPPRLEDANWRQSVERRLFALEQFGWVGTVAVSEGRIDFLDGEEKVRLSIGLLEDGTFNVRRFNGSGTATGDGIDVEAA